MTDKIKNIIIEDEENIAESEVQYNNLDARLQSSIDIANYLVQNDVSSNVFKEEYFGYGNKGTDTTITNRLGYKPEYLIEISGLKNIIVKNNNTSYDIAIVLHATKSTSTQVYDSGWINTTKTINILSYPTAHYASIRVRFKNDNNIDFDEIENITNITLYFISNVNENNINTEKIQEVINNNEVVIKSKKTVEDLQSEVSWLQSNVFDLKKDITSTTTQVNNKVFNISSLDNSISFDDSTTYKYRRATVIGGHSYSIKTVIGNSKYDYCFTDNSDNLIEKGTIRSTTGTYNIDLVAPAGSTRLYVNCLSTQGSNIYEYIKDLSYNQIVTLLNSNFNQLITDTTIRFDSSLFLNRGLNNQGTFNGLTYRVSNYDIQVANKELVLHAKTGFRFYVYKWGTISNPTTSPTMVGWFTEYTFNEGERFKISIARTSEDQTENANIDYFVSQIEIITNIATKDYIDNKISNPYKYPLPSYYDTYLEGKITDIHNLEQSAGYNSVTYAFITDFHTPSNKKKSIPLLERLKERTNATHLFYGGDSPSALGTLDDLKNQNYEVARLLYSIYGENYHYILGNHDYTIATGGSWGQGMESISTNAVHSIYKKGIDNPNRNYHLFDDEFNKIRHVFMDYTQAQTPWFLEWFRDTALNIPNDWNICFYCHLPFVDIEGAESAPDYMKKIANWICAFNNHTTFNATFAYSQWTTNINVDYSNIQSKVIYGAFGHIHKDSLTLKNGVYFFSTTCDAMYQDDGYGRTEGTVNENAFDVIHINELTKTVNLVRIGAGSDRSFVYSGN